MSEPARGLICSFCGKDDYDIEVMIRGPAVYICNECITLCNEIISDHKEQKIIQNVEKWKFDEFYGTD